MKSFDLYSRAAKVESKRNVIKFFCKYNIVLYVQLINNVLHQLDKWTKPWSKKILTFLCA